MAFGLVRDAKAGQNTTKAGTHPSPSLLLLLIFGMTCLCMPWHKHNLQRLDAENKSCDMAFLPAGSGGSCMDHADMQACTALFLGGSQSLLIASSDLGLGLQLQGSCMHKINRTVALEE